jgi:hypothetical protein
VAVAVDGCHHQAGGDLKMGLFGRKSQETLGTVTAEPPLALSAADLTAASQLMDRWDAARGDSDAMWNCLEAFARLGGFRSAEATLHAGYEMGDSYAAVRRPWRWWAEVARLASARDEHALVGRIFLFAAHFTGSILPRMDWVTQSDVGLSYPDGGTYQDLARSAVDSLSHLPADMLILNVVNDRVAVGSALNAAKFVASATDAQIISGQANR